MFYLFNQNYVRGKIYLSDIVGMSSNGNYNEKFLEKELNFRADSMIKALKMYFRISQ